MNSGARASVWGGREGPGGGVHVAVEVEMEAERCLAQGLVEVLSVTPAMHRSTGFATGAAMV
jgi:hypothetical protein